MKSSFKKAVTALLAAALLAAAPCTPVFGAQTYYVNDGMFEGWLGTRQDFVLYRGSC